MNTERLREQWKAEESSAHIHGWDFSHIEGRYEEENDLPWDYRNVVKEYLTPDALLLDIDTGGGEFLLSLQHPYNKTSATEAYQPNVKLCAERLLPLGIHFHEAGDYTNLPFDANSFDVVINRHGDYQVPELKRILKPGGVFITEQVGEKNDWELVQLLLPQNPIPYPGWNLKHAVADFSKNGFEILQQEKAFCPVKFYDVGALVWFAKIIEWEFAGFSVDRCFEQLCKAQRILEKDGTVKGQIHRFLIAAKKG